MTGSLRYMAPEVALGRAYNQSCDVYSFTLVFWEMLAMVRPYQEFHREKTFVNRVMYAGTRPAVRATWSDGCKKILQGGWRSRASKRWSMERIMSVLREELVDFSEQYEKMENSSNNNKRFDTSQRRSTFVFHGRAVQI